MGLDNIWTGGYARKEMTTLYLIDLLLGLIALLASWIYGYTKYRTRTLFVCVVVFCSPAAALIIDLLLTCNFHPTVRFYRLGAQAIFTLQFIVLMVLMLVLRPGD